MFLFKFNKKFCPFYFLEIHLRIDSIVVIFFKIILSHDILVQDLQDYDPHKPEFDPVF